MPFWKLETTRIWFQKRIQNWGIPHSCWLWTGGRNDGKYGSVHLNGKVVYAHRAAWILFVGEIPKGMAPQQTCGNPLCVNYQDHLKLIPDSRKRRFVWKLETARRRFMAHVDKGPHSGGCWLWTGAINGEYGATSYKGHGTQAHRAAYQLFVGPIPEGHVVRHKCDNGLCVNWESHLETGTQQENINDKMERGRNRIGERYRGEWNGSAKLTEEQVLDILTTPVSFAYRQRLAARYGVTVDLISKIRAGKLWKHITL